MHFSLSCYIYPGPYWTNRRVVALLYAFLFSAFIILRCFSFLSRLENYSCLIFIKQTLILGALSLTLKPLYMFYYWQMAIRATKYLCKCYIKLFPDAVTWLWYCWHDDVYGIYLSGNITRRYVSTLNYVHAFRDMLLIQLGVVCMKIKVNISLNETLDLSFPWYQFKVAYLFNM
jgi:hypothetical protein